MTSALLNFQYSNGPEFFTVFIRSDGQDTMTIFKEFCEKMDEETKILEGRLNFHYFATNAVMYFINHKAFETKGRSNNLIHITTKEAHHLDTIDFIINIKPIAEKYSDFTIPVFETFEITKGE